MNGNFSPGYFASARLFLGPINQAPWWRQFMNEVRD
jgi:hypothetical protein